MKNRKKVRLRTYLKLLSNMPASLMTSLTLLGTKQQPGFVWYTSSSVIHLISPVNGISVVQTFDVCPRPLSKIVVSTLFNVAACPKDEQQGTYLRYASSYLAHKSIRCLETSEAGCRQLCHSDARCLAFNLWPVTGWCCLKKDTPLDRPAEWFPGGAWYVNFYAVTCF